MRRIKMTEDKIEGCCHTINGYENDYHENRHQHLYNNPAYYRARAELSKRRYFKGNIERPYDLPILEFGVGLGQNLFWLPKGKRFGYDISDFAINFFKSKGGIATKDITKIEDESFGIVFSAHVLEHVDNPLETLRVMHSKLRTGGKLILITPLDKPKICSGPDINQHLFTWTPQLMINLLIKAGFTPLEYDIIPTFAYKKLLPFRKLGIGAYDFVTRLAGMIVRDRELKFVAVKRYEAVKE